MTLTVEQVFEAFGGQKAVAELLGLTVQAVSNMKARGAIPTRHWAPLVAEANARLMKEITFEAMAAMGTDADDAPASKTTGAAA
jgi:hypothetical protein